MLKAIHLNPQSIDKIYPVIGWPRRDLADYYETNTYYCKDVYIIVDEIDDETIGEHKAVNAVTFNKHYMFVEEETHLSFQEVIQIS